MFATLHLHTFHSILDGCGSIDNYVKLAREYNHPAMAITDHGTLSGTFEFWKKCKSAGVKSIMGMEAYVNDKQGEVEEKKYEGGNSHQSIFVMNKEGFVNLNRLAYKSYDEGFYKRGRIKTEWLIEHKSGLFITTSCAVSHMSKLVREGKEAEAEEYLKLARKKFSKLKRATELFVQIQPEISQHTNFQMAAASLVAAVGEVERLLAT